MPEIPSSSLTASSAALPAVQASGPRGTATSGAAPPWKRHLARYGVAFWTSAGALAMSAFTASTLQPSISFFYAAVVLSGWYGGLGPGIAAALLSTLGASLFFVPPVWGIGPAINPSDYFHVVVFLLVAILTGTLTESLHMAKAQAEAAAARAATTSTELRLEKRRTETILLSVSDSITVQDPSGRLVYANAAAARLLGVATPEALIGRSVGEVMSEVSPVDEQERPIELEDLPGRQAIDGEDEPERLLQYRDPASGQPRWALVRARPIRDESGRVTMAVSAAHDLTERIRHERTLEANSRALHQLTARLETTVEQLRREREEALTARAEAEAALERIVTLQGITVALSEARTPEDVATVALERGVRALRARSGVLLAFDGEEDSLRVVRAAGLPVERLERWRQANPRDVSVLEGALRRDALSFAETRHHPDGDRTAFDALRRALRADELASAPVATGGRPLGILAFDLNGRGELTGHEREFFLALGRQCAQALDRALLLAAERRARDDAEQASRAKSQFLAVMSHELRTPLNAILGYEELLETEVSGPITSVQKRHLTRIRESTHDLLALIEQILSLTRAQGGREDVRLEKVDAVWLARDAAALIEPQIRRKGLTLELDLPEQTRIELRTDPRKLRQILLNVLSNAVKFTERGAVRLSIECSPGALSFSVRDTGQGIEERDRDHIFEPFVQVRREGTLTSGTGLGLPVARELARHLGGDLTLESRPGEGSTFTLRLPDGGPPLPEPQREPADEEATPAGRN